MGIDCCTMSDTMKALLWKDYRLNRALLIVALVMLVAPYSIGVAVQLKNAQSTGMWGGTVGAAALAAMATSLLTVSLLAANVFAQERADRSAEFLATLPPSRLLVLLSKFILAAGVTGVLWGVNLAMGLMVTPRLGGFEPPLDQPAEDLLATSVLVFGAGWAASTVLASPVGAWGIASAAPMVLVGILGLSWYFLSVPTENQLRPLYVGSCLVLGAAAFVVSSVLYVRRVTP